MTPTVGKTGEKVEVLLLKKILNELKKLNKNLINQTNPTI